MCGSFGLTNILAHDLETRFNLSIGDYYRDEIYQPRFTPKSTIPSISRNSPNQLVMRYWSIIPPWIKDPKDLKYPTFNARAETLAEKPTFRTAWKKGYRCLIPVTQFYEWKKIYDGKKIIKRQPYTVTLQHQQIFSLAGLYQPWNDIETCTIITVDANHDLKDVHDRMPVIITPEDENTWLDKATSLESATALLQPYADDELRIVEGM